MNEIPDDHPRADSLNIRHRLIDGMHQNIVAEAGLIAHGRGEAFDYLLGEKTHSFAIRAIEAAAATLYLADNPIISVNGNVAVLCPDDLILFSRQSGIQLEVNLFYRSEKRLQALADHFATLGFQDMLGLDPEYYDKIKQLNSARRIVDTRGIFKADVVLVSLEDGDRTEHLIKQGKKVLTIDLNPLSRTARMANITIIDNVIRVIPLLRRSFSRIKDKDDATALLRGYDNKEIVQSSLETICQHFKQ